MSMLGHYASFKKGEHRDNNPEDIIGLFDRHNLKPRGCIHVGAHECPEMFCYDKLFKDKVVWVEANPETYTHKAKPVVEEHNQHIYNFAAYDKDDEELTLHIPVRDDISSLYLSEEFPHVRTAQVKTKKMDTLFVEENLDIDNFDFLNIDVEGAELKVLEGFKDNLEKINSIFIEVSLAPRFSGSEATLETIHNYLIERGFGLTEISSSIQTLGWGDAFYIRQ